MLAAVTQTQPDYQQATQFIHLATLMRHTVSDVFCVRTLPGSEGHHVILDVTVCQRQGLQANTCSFSHTSDVIEGGRWGYKEMHEASTSSRC